MRPSALTLATALFFGTGSSAWADTLGTAKAVPVASDTSTFIAVDLNRDGREDIVTSIPARKLLGVLIATPNGMFSNMPALRASGSIGSGDFNGDGNNDIVCVGSGGDDTLVSIFPGHGDGTFGDSSETSIPGFRRFVQVADFDGDGLPDLLTVPVVYGKLPVAVLLTRPMGLVSQPLEILDTLSTPVAADFDADGMTDIVVGVRVNFNSFVPSLFRGHGDGTFADPIALPGLAIPGSAGDFNGDGAIDIAGLADGGEEGSEPAIVRFAYGDGHGAFPNVEDVMMPALTSVERPVVDFDDDGRDDLLAIGKTGITEVRPGPVYLMHSVESGEPQRVELLVGLLPHTIIVGDLNGDRLPDLAVGGYEGLDDYDFTLSVRLNIRLAAFGVSAIVKPGKPFRVSVDGANFSTESHVFIGENDTEWSQVKFKSPMRLVVRGGADLERLFPPGVEVQIRIENPDGQKAVVSLVR